MNDDELDQLVSLVAQKLRAETEETEPDLEEILAYLVGELDESAADAFLLRLSLFPEAAKWAAELAEGLRGEPLEL